MLNIMTHSQCDRIWRNFATLVKKSSLWTIFEGIWLNFDPALAKNYAFGQIFIFVNGQILSKLSTHLVTLLIVQRHIDKLEANTSEGRKEEIGR